MGKSIRGKSVGGNGRIDNFQEAVNDMNTLGGEFINLHVATNNLQSIPTDAGFHDFMISLWKLMLDKTDGGTQTTTAGAANSSSSTEGSTFLGLAAARSVSHSP